MTDRDRDVSRGWELVVSSFGVIRAGWDPPGEFTSSWCSTYQWETWQAIQNGLDPDGTSFVFRWMWDPTIGRAQWVIVWEFRGSLWCAFSRGPAALLGRGVIADLLDHDRFDPAHPNVMIPDAIPNTSDVVIVDDDDRDPPLLCETCENTFAADGDGGHVLGEYDHERSGTVHVVCDSCVETCVVCGDPAIAYHDVCPECSGHVFSCAACDETTHQDSGYTIGDGLYSVCGSCYRRDYMVCDVCQWALALDQFSDPDQCVCDGCANDHDDDRGSTSSRIYSYTYKPLPEFHGYGPMFFGLEIETERADSSVRVGDMAERVADLLGSVAYLKHDGSLEEGFEIVTHPGSLDYWRSSDRLRDALAALQSDGWRSWNTSTCGLHVHVSRAAFTSRAHLFAFALFFYRNRDQVARFSGRRAAALDRWASLNDHAIGSTSYYRLIDKVNGSECGVRYTAVNLANRDTVEIRVFRGTLDHTSVMGAIELLAALVRFTGRLTSSDVRAGRLTWDEFVRSTPADEFPSLFATMTRRGISCVC